MNDTITPPSDASVADDIRTRNKAVIFAALAEAGIHSVNVGYDGYSDSGQIDDVEAWGSSPEKVPLPSNRKVQLPSPIQGEQPVEMTLQEAIETLVYDYLEETHYGWETGEGAYGTFVFSIPERTITLRHNDRYIEVNTSTHTICFDGGFAWHIRTITASLRSGNGAARSSTICRSTAGSTSRKRSSRISGTARCVITPRASSCWKRSSGRRSRSRPAR
jgi:hypothetical protein